MVTPAGRPQPGLAESEREQGKAKDCFTSTMGEDSQNTPEYPGGQRQDGGPIAGLVQRAPCWR